MNRYFEINENGHNIRCKLYVHDAKMIQRVIVFCHGFGGHKDNNAAEKFAQKLISKHKDCALITFNWPAHGDDVKKALHMDDCTVYLSLLLSYIEREFKPTELYAYATSFGGYTTLKYIFEHGNPFLKIALRCPAVNMYEVLTTAIMSDDDMAKLKKGKLVPVGFDRKILVGLPLLEELKNNDIQSWSFLEHADNILIIHGSADEIVPFNASQAFAENNLIDFIPIDKADHRFMDPKKMELANKHILEFFEL